MTVLALTVFCGFATWRLTSLLHTEDAFEWLRKWIGIGHDEDGYPRVYPETVLGSIFDCFWCLATVTAVPMTALLVWISGLSWSWVFLVWLASSAVAIWLEKQVLRSHSR